MKVKEILQKFKTKRKDVDAVAEDFSEPNVKNYFKLLWRKFPKLISLNLMMLFQVIPLLVIFLAYLWSPTTPSQSNVLYPVVYGAYVSSGGAPAPSLLLGNFGWQYSLPVFSTPVIIAIAIAAVFLLITFGWQNVGATYVLRELATAKPAFVWSDYFYAIRRNLKQGLVFGMFDIIALVVLGFDLKYFFGTSGSFGLDFMFFAILLISLLYMFMRFYIYLMMVTFDLSVFKLLKNALIFAVLGIKRNIMAVLGVLMFVSVNIVLIILFFPVGIVIPAIIPFFYLLSVASFTTTYAAYPNIKKYMITPYESDEGEDETFEEE